MLYLKWPGGMWNTHTTVISRWGATTSFASGGVGFLWPALFF